MISEFLSRLLGQMQRLRARQIPAPQKTNIISSQRSESQDSIAEMSGDTLAELSGYELRHLTTHLQEADRGEELHHLLRLSWLDTERLPHAPKERRRINAWYQAQEQLGQFGSYLADVARAWRLAEEAFHKDQSPTHLGLQCRYALVDASLGSIAKNVPPSLLGSLVEKGVWPATQGWAYATQIPDAEQRTTALVGVAPYLQGSERTKILEEAVAAAREVPEIYNYGSRRAKALIEMAPHLPESVLYEALKAALEIEDPKALSQALEGLAHFLPEPGLREALARAKENEFLGAEASSALAALTERLAELGYQQEALAAATKIESEAVRGKALARLAPHLTKPMLRKAFAVARKIRRDDYQAEALAGLAQHSPEPLLREALAAATEIGRGNTQGKALMAWAHRLAEFGYPEEAFPLVLQINEKELYVRSDALVCLAPYLPESLLRKALAAARDLDITKRGETLAGLAPRLAELGHLEEAVALGQEIGDNTGRALAFVGLAPYLSKEGRLETLRETVLMTLEIWHSKTRAEKLAELVPHLPEPLLREAIDAARRAKTPVAMTGLAPYLPESLLREAMPAVREAVGAALKMAQQVDRTDALDKLFPLLPEAERFEILRAALAKARMNPYGDQREREIATLASYLPRPLLLEAITAARDINDVEARSETLVEIAHHMPESERHQILREAFSTVRMIWDSNEQEMVLARLGGRLDKLGHFDEAVAVVRETWPEQDRTTVLARSRMWPKLHRYATWQVKQLANWSRWSADFDEPRKELADQATRWAKLLRCKEELVSARKSGVPRGAPSYGSEEQLRWRLAAARGMEDLEARAKELTVLAPYFPDSLFKDAVALAREIERLSKVIKRQADRAFELAGKGHHNEALAAARKIQQPFDQATVIAGLIPGLSDPQRTEALSDILVAARKVIDEKSEAQLLVWMSPYLTEPLLRKALAIAQRIMSNVDRARALAVLVPRLAELGFPEDALAMALEIEDQQKQGQALVGASPYLTDSLSLKAFAAARKIRSTDDRARTLAGIATYLPEAERAGALREALTAAWEISDANENARIWALGGVTRRLVELGYIEEALAATSEIRRKSRHAGVIVGVALSLAEMGNLREALNVAREIQDPREREEALDQLPAYLAQLDPPRLYSIWRETLPVLASRTRKDFLSDLRPLLPVVASLGGTEALNEIYRAIRDVGRWWP